MECAIPHVGADEHKNEKGVADAPRADGSRFLLSFFFFQAEGGIRDYKVTGVQTCALPILLIVTWGRPPPSDVHVHVPVRVTPLSPPPSLFGYPPKLNTPGSAPSPWHAGMPPRSEERRVGKEGRSRWSPYH